MIKNANCLNVSSTDREIRKRLGSYIVEKISHVEDEPAKTGHERARSKSWETSDIVLTYKTYFKLAN